MDIRQINQRLSAISPGYSARFVAAEDCSVDDEIEILLSGARTRWGIQLGEGYAAVHEYGFEDGELAWSQDHGCYRRLEAAVTRLCALLGADRRS